MIEYPGELQEGICKKGLKERQADRWIGRLLEIVPQDYSASQTGEEQAGQIGQYGRHQSVDTTGFESAASQGASVAGTATRD